MFGRLRQFQIRLAAVACLSLPAMTFAQDNAPAPPPPEDDAVPSVTEKAPAAEEDGVARVPAAGCRAGGCGPACAPNGKCGTGNACGANGKCGNGAGGCSSDGACRSGACAANGGCKAGCNGACGNPGCKGTPCLTCPSNCLSPEICMGRPYTIGDLKRDWHGLSCKAKEACGLEGCSNGGILHDWWCNQQYRSNCRRAYRNHVLSAHLHNKLNYFIPSGCCGEGCPPFGMYKRVYAADPSYYDQRDTRLYAAPATGVPTAIPLAPNVRYQYNYSWGSPSSRVTPISNPSLRRR